jgi:hypothetical protein
MTPAARDDVEAEVNQLSAMPIAEIRKRWRAAFKSEPPKAFGPDLLRRSLAHKLQEDAYGGLAPTTRKLLNQLMAQSAKNGGKFVVTRQIKAGAILSENGRARPTASPCSTKVLHLKASLIPTYPWSPG